MPLRRYVAATAVGAIAWAAVYTTVGMTILAAWLTAPIGRIVSVLTDTALALIVMGRPTHKHGWDSAAFSCQTRRTAGF